MQARIFDKTKGSIAEGFGFTREELNQYAYKYGRGQVGEVIERIITSTEIPKSMKYLMFINLGVEMNIALTTAAAKQLAEEADNTDAEGNTAEPDSSVLEVFKAQDKASEQTSQDVLG